MIGDKFLTKLNFEEGVEVIVAMAVIVLGLVIMATAFRFISPLDFSARMLVGSATMGIFSVFLGNLKRRIKHAHM